MEVESEIGDLVLELCGDVFYGRDVERDKTIVDGDEHCGVLFVHKELPRLDVLGEGVGVGVATDVFHLFDLLLLGRDLDLVVLELQLQLLKLLVQQVVLALLSSLIVSVLPLVLLTETGPQNHIVQTILDQLLLISDTFLALLVLTLVLLLFLIFITVCQLIANLPILPLDLAGEDPSSVRFHHHCLPNGHHRPLGLLLYLTEGHPHMERHTRLHHNIISLVDEEDLFLEGAPDSKPEVRMNFVEEGGVLGGNDLLAKGVGVLDGAAHLEPLDHRLQGLIRHQVRRLLRLTRVHYQGPTRHRIHVLIFPTDVEVDCLRIQLVLIALDIELGDIDVLAGLDEDGQEVLKEGRVGSRVLASELLYEHILLQEPFNLLLDVNMFHLLLSVEDIFYLIDDLLGRPGHETRSHLHVLALSLQLHHVHSVHQFLHLHLVQLGVVEELHDILDDAFFIAFVLQEEADPALLLHPAEKLLEHLIRVVRLWVPHNHFQLRPLIVHRDLHAFQEGFLLR
mmetsp:Transcript_39635/g.38172  ORF Transcript_39635/g.38172 Transcript_39635/m.38172 type:complete len:509 (-) Transcript_39635:246-1772(-)